MVDAVQVFPPGFRVLDSVGEPVNAAKIKFRVAGLGAGGAPKTVYSDKLLSVSLGTTVWTNSEGFPVASFGSSDTVLIYTGSADYCIEITDSDDVALFPLKDNTRGAVDTSSFLTSAAAINVIVPVISKTGDYMMVSGDKGKLINANPTGGSFTLTFDNASTLGDNWNIRIRNAGTANPVKLSAAQGIAHPSAVAGDGTTLALALDPGEAMEVICDGAAFKVSGYVPARLTKTVGVLTIVSRVSAVPSSPTPGARYIATGSFTAGALSVIANDIIEATGQSTWFKIDPPSNAGWLAYVQAESIYYYYTGTAWASYPPTATTSIAGITTLADIATVRAGADQTKPVSAGLARYSQGAVKAFVDFNNAGVVNGSYNVTSITKNGTGDFTIIFTLQFVDASYAVLGFARTDSGANINRALIVTAEAVDSKTFAQCRVRIRRDDATLVDPSSCSVAFLGPAN